MQAIKLRGKVSSEGILEVPKCPELSNSRVEVVILHNEVESKKAKQSIQWPALDCGRLLKKQI